MITVRPIAADEFDLFASVGTDQAHQNDVKMYVEKMLAAGSMRLDWCFVVENEEEPLGRIAYWTLPKLEKPLDFVLLELPWEREDCFSLGEVLLRETLTCMRSLGTEEIGYVVDTPSHAPHWQKFTEERMEFLIHAGFTVARETYRFERNNLGAVAHKPSELHYRTLSQVGKSAFVKAIEQVSESSFDQRTMEGRERHGAEAEAQSTYADLQQMEYDPSWWQLAYDSNDELVGLVMPTKSTTFATIGYIGVVPEKRGRGYIDVLLHHGTAILSESGATLIRADTDVSNLPMANAFKRAGYHQFAIRREFSLPLSR